MFKKFTDFKSIPADRQKDALELKDGGYVLDEPDEALTASVATLEGTTKRLRREKDEADGKVVELTNKLGEANRKLDASAAAGQNIDTKLADALKKWETDTATAVANAVAAKDKEIASLTDRVTKYDLDDVLGEAFKAAGGREDRVKRATAQAKLEGWTLVDNKTVLKDADGTITTTQPKDFFAGKFKKDVPEWYVGSKADGGAGSGNGVPNGAPGTGDGKTDKVPSKMTTDERRAYIEANGPQEYQKLLNAELLASTTPQTPSAKT